MGDAPTWSAGRLRGELLLPDDHGYDDARRGYNRLHDRRPAVVVRPADGADVARALEFATSAGLEVAVRSGGHSLVRRGGHRRHRGWVQTLAGAIRYLARRAYLNFLDAADEDRLHEAYPDGTYRRLVEVKRRYDPTNLFHRNLNIRPADASSRLGS
jgi:FAD/FMN-containing dehydrogenase